jgi:hypothetical protein
MKKVYEDKLAELRKSYSYQLNNLRAHRLANLWKLLNLFVERCNIIVLQIIHVTF